MALEMLKKRLGIEGIEKNWGSDDSLRTCFKVPSTFVIPEGCWRVGDFAFEKCTNLEKAIIPESVVRIGVGAFDGCIKLKEVVISKNVKEIWGYAFEGCSSLREVEIPEGAEEIGNYAFYGCENATIVLKKPQKEFKYIGETAFVSCWYVKEEIR